MLEAFIYVIFFVIAKHHMHEWRSQKHHLFTSVFNWANCAINHEYLIPCQTSLLDTSVSCLFYWALRHSKTDTHTYTHIHPHTSYRRSPQFNEFVRLFTRGERIRRHFPQLWKIRLNRIWHSTEWQLYYCPSFLLRTHVAWRLWCTGILLRILGYKLLCHQLEVTTSYAALRTVAWYNCCLHQSNIVRYAIRCISYQQQVLQTGGLTSEQFLYRKTYDINEFTVGTLSAHTVTRCISLA